MKYIKLGYSIVVQYKKIFNQQGDLVMDYLCFWGMDGESRSWVIIG